MAGIAVGFLAGQICARLALLQMALVARGARIEAAPDMLTMAILGAMSGLALAALEAQVHALGRR